MSEFTDYKVADLSLADCGCLIGRHCLEYRPGIRDQVSRHFFP